ncbi:hypothetical protein BVY04_04870, partial [bacterium M21]
FVARYGFDPEAAIMAWSGDNPNSLVGLGLVSEGSCALSLGTSDTLFAFLKDKPASAMCEGHLFVSPTGDYMDLLCFANGSLARERVRDEFKLDWKQYGEEVNRTEPGNGGKLMLAFYGPEITPKTSGPIVRKVGLEEGDVSGTCRAVVEGQMLGRKLHANRLGIQPKQLLLTGGASVDKCVRQICADIFECPVACISTTASAAMGAALRAYDATTNRPLEEIVRPFVVTGEVTQPQPETFDAYRRLFQAYQEFEEASCS